MNYFKKVQTPLNQLYNSELLSFPKDVCYEMLCMANVQLSFNNELIHLHTISMLMIFLLFLRYKDYVNSFFYKAKQYAPNA